MRILAMWRKDTPSTELLEDGIEVVRVAPYFTAVAGSKLSRVLCFISWYVAVLVSLKGKKVDCVNCHSLTVLPLCVAIKLWKRCPLIYEPHELETETSASRGIRKKVARGVERSLIAFSDAVCVVNRSIAAWYEKTYNLSPVVVVRNVPYRNDTPPSRTGVLRRRIGLNDDNLLFIYQGLLSDGRGINILIEALERLPNSHHLVFMGYGPLTDRVQKAAQQHANCHYVPAVPPDKIQGYTVDADVGIALIEDVCLSYRLCLPNKLFEYAACGLPSIVSDFPEMGSVIREFECGWCVPPRLEAFVDRARTITCESVAAKREKALRASRENCWQNEELPLLGMYRSLGFPPQGSNEQQLSTTRPTRPFERAPVNSCTEAVVSWRSTSKKT